MKRLAQRAAAGAHRRRERVSAPRKSRLHRSRRLRRHILNLAPGTEYECRFQLTDPDGTTGQTSHVVRVKTRTEPMPSKEGRTLHVYPSDYQGQRIEPSFTSVLQAYYGAGLGDWSVVWERRAQPGDTILVHVGLYKPERLQLRRSDDGAVRRLDVADAEGHERKAHHD